MKSRAFGRDGIAPSAERRRARWAWRSDTIVAFAAPGFPRQIAFSQAVRRGPPQSSIFAAHGAKLLIWDRQPSAGRASKSRRGATRKFLEAKGYRMVRFWNNEVLTNVDGVLKAIERSIATMPAPSPQGARARGRSA